MERVDKHKEQGDRAVWRYMSHAWFARQHMTTRGFVVNTERYRTRWEWPGSHVHARLVAAADAG